MGATVGVFDSKSLQLDVESLEGEYTADEQDKLLDSGWEHDPRAAGWGCAPQRDNRKTSGDVKRSLRCYSMTLIVSEVPGIKGGCRRGKM